MMSAHSENESCLHLHMTETDSNDYESNSEIEDLDEYMPKHLRTHYRNGRNTSSGSATVSSNSDGSDHSGIGNMPVLAKKSKTRATKTHGANMTRSPAMSTTGTPITSRSRDELLHSNSRSAPLPHKNHIEDIINNQKQIISAIKGITKDLREMKEHLAARQMDRNEPVFVPNKIRNAVKDAYGIALDKDISWDFTKRFTAEENTDMLESIKSSVLGIVPDAKMDVLQVAIKRYFTSKKEAACRAAKNKGELHKKRQATYERKKEKTKRRLIAVDRKKWPSEKKAKIKLFFKHKEAYKYMSSDEECGDGFTSHGYSWESEEFCNIKKSLDKTYLEVCSARSRRLLLRRTNGDMKQQDPPHLENSFRWILRD